MRVIAGPEKKTRLFSEEERKITAYHELGHAIVGHYLDEESDVHKISIIGRGQALGYTISLPREDRYLTTKADADEPAGDDARRPRRGGDSSSTRSRPAPRTTSRRSRTTAKQMIMRFGMSEKLGPRVLGRNHDMPFLGREMGNEPDYSEEIAREIDDEIRRVIEEAHMTATRGRSRSTCDELHQLSLILIERETIDKDQFERLLAGEEEDRSSRRRPRRRSRSPRPRRRRSASPEPKTRPFPIPGATMQPPPPEGAKANARSSLVPLGVSWLA